MTTTARYLDHDKTQIELIRDGRKTVVPVDPNNALYKKLQTMDIIIADPPTEESKVPTVVTAYQAKMALLGANLYTQVETAVNMSPDPSFKIAWQTAPTFERNSPFILAMGPALGMSNTDIDQLFIAAAGIS